MHVARFGWGRLRTIACALVACAAVVYTLVLDRSAPAAEPGESGEHGFVTLFDGQNLDAWRMSPTAAWKIQQGTITLDRPDGALNNTDYLWTKDTFADFVLELEFCVCEGYCNSGIFLRTADLADPVYTGIEMQIANSFGRDGLSRGSTAGAIYDCAAPSSNPVKPPGEWNTCRITCRGKMIIVELNGQQIVEMDLDRWTETGRNPDGTPNKFTRPLKEFSREGHIGLQDHGRPVWFRNIRVKRL